MALDYSMTGKSIDMAVRPQFPRQVFSFPPVLIPDVELSSLRAQVCQIAGPSE